MNEERESYDQSITIYSPDGRMYQVEYAREAVKKGSISIGMEYKDGIILMVEKRVPSILAIPESVEKIFKLEKNIACSTSGLIADSRILVDYARDDIAGYQTRYAEDIPVLEVVKRICNIKRIYTQYGGVRPFGVSFLIGGIDNTGKTLFETDPSGAYKQYHAGAIGDGKQEVEEYFETRYKDSMTFQEAIALIFEALEQGLGKNLNETNVELVTVSEKDFYKVFTDDEINSIKKKYKSKKK